MFTTQTRHVKDCCLNANIQCEPIFSQLQWTTYQWKINSRGTSKIIELQIRQLSRPLSCLALCQSILRNFPLFYQCNPMYKLLEKSYFHLSIRYMQLTWCLFIADQDESLLFTETTLHVNVFLLAAAVLEICKILVWFDCSTKWHSTIKENTEFSVEFL